MEFFFFVNRMTKDDVIVNIGEQLVTGENSE